MSSPTRSGFSLVEALVAVVLAGGGIAALVSAIGATTRGEAKAIQSEKMQRLAVQKLDEVIATQDFNSQGGNFADDGEPDMDWSMTDDTTSVENLEQVTVTVSKSNDSNTSQVVSTLFYRRPAETSAGPNQ